MHISSSVKANPAWSAFLGAVFMMGVSLPAARLMVAVCLVCTIYEAAKKRVTFRLSLPGVGWLVYFALALVATFIFAKTNTDALLDPAKGLAKTNKLIWYIALPLTATHVNSKERFVKTLKWYVGGCLISALMVLVVNPIGAWVQMNLPKPKHIAQGRMTALQARLVAVTDFLRLTDHLQDWIHRGWRARTYHDAIVKLGTMQAAQRLMVAVPAALFLMLDIFRNDAERRRRAKSVVVFAFISLGLIMTFKRGPLMAAVAAVLPLAIKPVGVKKVIAALVLVCALVVAIPSARTRLMDISNEFSTQRGGRMTMWAEIVPALHAEHPWGIGFRALTNEKMQSISPQVELRQNHVHSTPLQAFIEFGFLGAAAWLFWMATGFVAGVRNLRTGCTATRYGLTALAPIAMLTALFLYGMIEYNLADADIVMLYSLSMGLCAMRFRE